MPPVHRRKLPSILSAIRAFVSFRCKRAVPAQLRPTRVNKVELIFPSAWIREPMTGTTVHKATRYPSLELRCRVYVEITCLHFALGSHSDTER
jgi:hypothetical protein